MKIPRANASVLMGERRGENGKGGSASHRKCSFFQPGRPLPPVLGEAESSLVGAAGEFPKNSINIDKFTRFFDKLIY